jgi:aminoglycoside 6'-N-acetyltransferase
VTSSLTPNQVGGRRTLAWRPVNEADLPLLATWLALPHVTAWWGSAPSLDKVRALYGPGADPTTEFFIVLVDGEPIGFVQRYRLEDDPDWLKALSPALDGHGMAGIDYLVARPGQGYGTRIIEGFTRALFLEWPDVTAVVAVPQAANRASWRALLHAGFRSVWTGRTSSTDPSDAGPSVVCVRYRQGR